MAETNQVVTGNVRLSYVHLFEPHAVNEGDDPRYSAVLLIPKSDKATLKKMEAARKVATETGKAKYGASWGKRGLHYTLHDGDVDADLEKNPEYAGHMYLSVASPANRKPGVVDRNVQPILDSTEVYSGCYARVSLGAFPYKAKGNEGISFGLNHVQKVRDGEPLGGMTRAESVFDEIDDDEFEDDDDLI